MGRTSTDSTMGSFLDIRVSLRRHYPGQVRGVARSRASQPPKKLPRYVGTWRPYTLVASKGRDVRACTASADIAPARDAPLPRGRLTSGAPPAHTPPRLRASIAA